MATPESSRRATHVGPTEPATLDTWTLEVSGLVAQPSRLTLGDLADLEGRASLTSKTQCPDGPIGTDGSTFEGVPLAWLVEQAGVLEDARYVCVHSGPFTAAFALDSLDRRQSLLATRKDGHRLTWIDGGPVRLVVEQGACFDTVKWVTQVTLERDASSATALSIVRSRRAAEAEHEART